MNHKTRKIAKGLYEFWRDDVSQYAPPESHIASFSEQRDHFMRNAVKIKKTLAYRSGENDFWWEDYE